MFQLLTIFLDFIANVNDRQYFSLRVTYRIALSSLQTNSFCCVGICFSDFSRAFIKTYYAHVVFCSVYLIILHVLTEDL